MLIDVYDKLVFIFVVSFIGLLVMNFLDVKVSGFSFELVNGSGLFGVNIKGCDWY